MQHKACWAAEEAFGKYLSWNGCCAHHLCHVDAQFKILPCLAAIRDFGYCLVTISISSLRIKEIRHFQRRPKNAFLVQTIVEDLQTLKILDTVRGFGCACLCYQSSYLPKPYQHSIVDEDGFSYFRCVFLTVWQGQTDSCTRNTSRIATSTLLALEQTLPFQGDNLILVGCSMYVFCRGPRGETGRRDTCRLLPLTCASGFSEDDQQCRRQLGSQSPAVYPLCTPWSGANTG